MPELVAGYLEELGGNSAIKQIVQEEISLAKIVACGPAIESQLKFLKDLERTQTMGSLAKSPATKMR